MMRRKYWIIAIATLLLLVAGDVAYWRIAAERLRTGYEAWLAARVTEGWNVESGPVSVGGWPRAATISVPTLGMRHAGPTIPGDVSITAAGLQLAVALLNPLDLRLSLTGPLHIRAGDSPDMIVAGEEAVLTVPLRQTEPFAGSLHARDLSIEPAGGAGRMAIGLMDARLEVEADRATSGNGPVATFSISSEAIALPTTLKWPLGPNISSLSLDGRLNGPVPATREIRTWAESWRDGGGSLEVSRLTLGWGPLGLTSAATLALYEQLQPMGSGNGRVVGYAATLDKLAAGGMLTKSAATVAKALLSLMAGAEDPDQPSSVDVPLTLQYRTLSMRQVPLVRLPELDWPPQ